MRTQEQQALALECLNMAARSAGASTPEKAIQLAQQYLDFITGADLPRAEASASDGPISGG